MSAPQVVRASGRLAVARGSRAAASATPPAEQKPSDGDSNQNLKLIAGTVAAVGVGGAIYWVATAESRAKAAAERQDQLRLNAIARAEEKAKQQRADEYAKFQRGEQQRMQQEQQQRSAEDIQEMDCLEQAYKKDVLDRQRASLTFRIPNALQDACESVDDPQLRAERCRAAIAMASELKALGGPLEKSSLVLDDPRLRQAEVFLDPGRLLRILITQDTALFEGSDLMPSAGDFVYSAERLSKTDIASEDLLQELLDVAKALATHRERHIPEMRRILETQRDAKEKAYTKYGGTDAVVQSMSATHECNSLFKRVRLEAEAKALNTRQIREVVEQVFQQTNQKLQPVFEHVENTCNATRSKEIKNQMVELQEVRADLASLGEDLDVSEIVQGNEHWRAKVTLALAGFEDAMASGGAKAVQAFVVLEQAVVGDEFLCSVLGQLPRDALERCSQGFTLQEALQRRFAALSGDLKSIALSPGQGLGAAIMGRLLGGLYILEPAAIPPPALRISTTHRNLAAIGEAAAALERGHVAEVIQYLEALEGPCRTRAQGWITDARHSLLIDQAITAARARLRCIQQMSSEG
eukprot:gnl/MRDRNA2_/MRDRNA2_110890_c0_seq1.p1 gnl/MRDRNA2_/MRDRNA2_110890_c0~~gnl/MRDRNA2_/MRDRNA2_110890_c0_seq1.p1  ORF type:complete len:582 (-),score=143.77 gnl/MRDRNA2_/MRDRNA2_110890_c0_seq1:178-1923(-)